MPPGLVGFLGYCLSFMFLEGSLCPTHYMFADVILLWSASSHMWIASPNFPLSLAWMLDFWFQNVKIIVGMR